MRTKILQIKFFSLKKKIALLNRFKPTREAFIHSILMSEVKNLRSYILKAIRAIFFFNYL
jgi:hypothetical protein